VPLGLALETRATTDARPGRAGFRTGYLMGFVFFLGGLHWIAFLKPVAVTISWIMYPAWVAGAAYLALYPALAGMAASLFRARLGVPMAAALPLAWLAAEKLRSLGEMGFPWLSIGYTPWRSLELIQWASIGGVALVGAWFVAVNGCVLAAWLARSKGRGGRAIACIVAAVVLGLIAFFGGRALLPAATPGGLTGPSVALVQGNVPGEIKWSGTHQKEVLAKFLHLTRLALAQHPDLVIWPETATGSYLRRDLPSLIAVQSLVDSSGVPLLAGYPDYQLRPDNTYRLANAAGVFAPKLGLIGQYEKMHLVPFGERLPFEWLIPALGKIDFGQAEFAPGDSLVLLPADGEMACVLVCFESIFEDAPRRARRRGATLLVNITNDEWFGRTGALYQHAAMAVFRSVETRLPLARCANTGLTFFVTARGEPYGMGGVFEDLVRLEKLDTARPAPLFVRTGDVLGAAVLALAALGVLACALRPRRRSAPLEPTSG
jgi:apolipoprotein N-acyltransferase